MSSLSLPLPSPPVHPTPSRPRSLVSEPLTLFLPSLYFLLPSDAVGSPDESGSRLTACPPMPASSSGQTKEQPPHLLLSFLPASPFFPASSPFLLPSLSLSLSPLLSPSTSPALSPPPFSFFFARARAPAPLAGQPPLAVVSSGRGAWSAPGSSSSNHAGNDGDRDGASTSASAVLRP